MIEPNYVFSFTMPFVPDLPFSFLLSIVREKIKASKPDTIHSNS